MRREYYLEPILAPLERLHRPLVFRKSKMGFEHLLIHQRGASPKIAKASEFSASELAVFVDELPSLENAPDDVSALLDASANPTRIMGILNLTPDSFSDGGKYVDEESASARMNALIKEGADIIDIGAQSTRPGAREISTSEETKRLRPVLSNLGGLDCPISVDTQRAEIAEEAIRAGALMINDVSALEGDGEMAPLLARHNTLLCLMHKQGTPETMQDAPRYDHALLDIYDYLEARIEFARAHGIEKARIHADPGVGFGKVLGDNIQLLRHGALFHGLGVKLLFGVSRKSMINAISPSHVDQRLAGSLAIACDLAQKQVGMIRVHDVFETRQALHVHAAIANLPVSGAN